MIAKSLDKNEKYVVYTDEWTLGEVKKLCSALKVEVDPNEAATICRCLGIQIRREAGAAANSL